MKKILLASPRLLGNEVEYVLDALKSGWIAPLGEYVNRLEKGIEGVTGAKGAVAVSSGTAAIHLALLEAGVKAGDTVFCSDMTFTASANPILYCGATPVFIDSERESFNMSPVALEKAFKKYKPKAVIVASVYGVPAMLEEIADICNRYDCTMIEDSTEVLGSTYHNKPAGTWGKYGTFSFNGNKVITTSGGGMLVSNDLKSLTHALSLATQAKKKSRYYEHEELGYNYRLSNISAAIGVGQLEKLDEAIELRRDIYFRYAEALERFYDYGVRMLAVPEDRTSNFWLSILTLDDVSLIKPEEIVDVLAREDIEARHIWKPLHTQKLFSGADFIREDDKAKMSNSDYFFTHGVCLPSDVNMTEADQDRVISVMRSYIDLVLRVNYEGGSEAGQLAAGGA